MMDIETILTGMAVNQITIHIDGSSYIAKYMLRGQRINMGASTATAAIVAAIEQMSGYLECERSGHLLPEGAECFEFVDVFICSRCGSAVGGKGVCQ